jgi:hypothetical protein
VPAEVYVYGAGFWTVLSLVPSLSKSHANSKGSLPVDWSINVTVSGAVPDRGVVFVKSAAGNAVTGITHAIIKSADTTAIIVQLFLCLNVIFLHRQFFPNYMICIVDTPLAFFHC